MPFASSLNTAKDTTAFLANSLLSLVLFLTGLGSGGYVGKALRALLFSCVVLLELRRFVTTGSGDPDTGSLVVS